MDLIKNLEKETTLKLTDIVSYEDGKVVSLSIAQKPGVAMTLFAFDEGTSISTHAAPGDALAFVLEGNAEITIDGKPHTLCGGEAIVMPESIPHSVKAVSRFKMYLTVIKKTEG